MNVAVSIQACRLPAGNFSGERLIFHADQQTGQAQSIDYSIGTSSSTQGTSDSENIQLRFDDVTISTSLPGPSPAANVDTLLYRDAPKLPEPEPGLLRRYWYFVLPLVIGLIGSSLGGSGE